HVRLTESKYTKTDSNEPIDLVSTEAEWAAPLRTDLRMPCKYEKREVEENGRKTERFVCVPSGEADQVDYNIVDWELVEQQKDRCVFSYESDDVSLKKTVAATGRPFELSVALEVTNKA